MEFNRNRIIYCPICNSEIIFLPQRISSHLKSCAKKVSLPYKEVRKQFLIKNWPEFSTKELFLKAYNIYSIPDFQKQFGLNDPGEFCEIYNIPKRTIQEANKANGIGQSKIKKVVKKKYGVDNVLSKNSPFYEKRNNTVKESYGVDNIFQSEEIKNKIFSDDLYLIRYGMTRRELRSKTAKEVWQRLSDDEKQQWLSKSIHKESSLKNINKRSFNQSSYELKILNILSQSQFSFKSQFIIRKTKNSFYAYDFIIYDLNLILEINSDYWHANPSIYKADDLIQYPGHQLLASEVWKKDLDKKKLAISKGYNIIYIWSKDIKAINSLEDLLTFIHQNL